jgi:hypothetical protein
MRKRNALLILFTLFLCKINFLCLAEELKSMEFVHSHPTGFKESAGTICLALPHGRDE